MFLSGFSVDSAPEMHCISVSQQYFANKIIFLRGLMLATYLDNNPNIWYLVLNKIGSFEDTDLIGKFENYKEIRCSLEEAKQRKYVPREILDFINLPRKHGIFHVSSIRNQDFTLKDLVRERETLLTESKKYFQGVSFFQRFIELAKSNYSKASAFDKYVGYYELISINYMKPISEPINQTRLVIYKDEIEGVYKFKKYGNGFEYEGIVVFIGSYQICFLGLNAKGIINESVYMTLSQQEFAQEIEFLRGVYIAIYYSNNLPNIWTVVLKKVSSLTKDAPQNLEEYKGRHYTITEAEKSEIPKEILNYLKKRLKYGIVHFEHNPSLALEGLTQEIDLLLKNYRNNNIHNNRYSNNYPLTFSGIYKVYYLDYAEQRIEWNIYELFANGEVNRQDIRTQGVKGTWQIIKDKTYLEIDIEIENRRGYRILLYIDSKSNVNYLQGFLLGVNFRNKIKFNPILFVKVENDKNLKAGTISTNDSAYQELLEMYPFLEKNLKSFPAHIFTESSKNLIKSFSENTKLAQKYFNSACFLSIKGKTAEALTDLDLAFTYGFRDRVLLLEELNGCLQPIKNQIDVENFKVLTSS